MFSGFSSAIHFARFYNRPVRHSRTSFFASYLRSTRRGIHSLYLFLQ